jgi:hypothetical protein
MFTVGPSNRNDIGGPAENNSKTTSYGKKD